MAERFQKSLGKPERVSGMLKDLKSHHNMFWDSVERHHLEPLLTRTYSIKEKRKLIARWLGKNEVKRILIKQLDCYSDPLLIELRKDGFRIKILDEEEGNSAEIIFSATHLGLIALTDRLSAFIFGWIRKDFRLPRFFKNFRDHYFAMRVFLGKE